MLVVVKIILWGLAIVIFIIVIDGVVLLYRLTTGTCGLRKALLFPDTCGGSCPPGGVCLATATRPYMFGLGTQSAACACTGAGGGGTGGGGTTGGGSGGGSSGGGTSGSGAGGSLGEDGH
jgi:uncharacterized membrane protein YgcG